MSSFVIGLDIGGSHITACLIDCETLNIINDLFYTRIYPLITQQNPRFIVASWIECLNDLLQDFRSNQNENDRIIGIACGIPGPMDYERAISLIQSSKFNKFDRCFGLNIRHAFRYALRELSFRWKTFPQLEFSSMTKRNDQHGILSTSDFNTDSNQFCGFHEEEEEEENSSRRSSSFVSSTKKTSRSFFQIDDLIEIPLTFENDATCFALGESLMKINENYRRILALTLGTGFGSTFIDGKEIIRSRSDVPPGGMLWNVAFNENSIADQWFSTRGLNRIYEILSQNSSIDENSAELFSSNFSTENFLDGSQLAQRASNGDEIATKTFEIFAKLLAKFLVPFLEKFRVELLVIGGGLTNAWFLFEFELKSILEQHFPTVDVYFDLSQEKSICLGAAQLHFDQIRTFRRDLIRKTSQNLLPVTKRIDTSIYDLYPSHLIRQSSIGVGHRNLQKKISRLIDEHQIVLIDGFVGTNFDEFAEELMKIYFEMHRNDSLLTKRLNFYDSRAFLRDNTEEKRRTYLKSSKSIFGRVANDLDFRKDFVDAEKLKYFRENLSRPCVVIGLGASILSQIYPLIYIDLAKNELYYRIAGGSTSSFFKPLTTIENEFPSNDDDYQLSSMMFEQKSLYFLDYPILNKLKVELVHRIDIFVDGQRPRCPTWIYGDVFRRSLENLSDEIVRVRPWFESGPWGGQWLKSVCSNLSTKPTNYAWSFELIAPENGILFSDEENHLIEFSWEFFYGTQSNRILGNVEHRRLYSHFDEFPIRFDFLDTIDGGNLSIQCHPNRTYIREHFGEKITQDETYYILKTKNDENDSKVYLGFQPDVDPEEFYQDLLKSRRERKEFDVEKYVDVLPSKTHDLFLIPNETIHASGKDQVVLEISATPYFYTFKLYDWLRAGLDGNLRPLNIEHGIRNLKFDRRGENLRSKAILISSVNEQFDEEILPTHDEHFYEIQRLTFYSNGDETFESIRSTENRFHLCMLVEGEAIEISYRDQIRRYNYIETFLIPASIDEYRIRPIRTKAQRSILLIAFLKHF